MSPSHTSHSTATRLKLGDSLPLFTGQNYNSVAAFIDETYCGIATTLILRYLLLHNIIAHLLLNIVFKTILICCACQLTITYLEDSVEQDIEGTWLWVTGYYETSLKSLRLRKLLDYSALAYLEYWMDNWTVSDVTGHAMLVLLDRKCNYFR